MLGWVARLACTALHADAAINAAAAPSLQGPREDHSHNLRLRMISRWLRWLTLFGRFGAPLVVVVYLSMPIYDVLRPWPVAERQLSQYTGQHHIMIGFSMSHREDYVAHTTIGVKARSYILFPSVFRQPRTVTVTEVEGEEAKLSENALGFVYNAFWFVVAVGLTWRLWSRRPEQDGYGFMPPADAGLTERALFGSASRNAIVVSGVWEHVVHHPNILLTLAGAIFATILLLVLIQNTYWWVVSLALTPAMIICVITWHLVRRRR